MRLVAMMPHSYILVPDGTDLHKMRQVHSLPLSISTTNIRVALGTSTVWNDIVLIVEEHSVRAANTQAIRNQLLLFRHYPNRNI